MKHSWRTLAIILLLAGVGVTTFTGCPNPTPMLTVASQPPGAVVTLDGKPVGTTPWKSDVHHGTHHVQVTLAGYRPWEQRVTLEQYEFRELHADLVPLQGTLEVIVTPDGAAVAVDDISRCETPCRLDLPSGDHDVIVSAPGYQSLSQTVAIQDNQVTRLEGDLDLLPAPISTPSRPTASPTPTPTLQTKTNPTPTQPPAVRTRETTVAIPTYQYGAALRKEHLGRIPYPQLDFERVGAPVSQDYRAIVVENHYLQLTFLPELGGRLYRCVFKPTGQDVFYRNPVIKPTHWGPGEMGWWIAAGGMEWCFPVWEHGYTTALPWQCRTRREADGSVTFIAEDDEELTGLHITVAVTLRPNRAAIEVQPTVSNPTGQSQTYKLWVNALLGLGAHRPSETTRFALPVSEVVVHSTGDETLPQAGERMSWPVPNGAGRDLSYYVHWRSFLGLFAAPPAPTWAGAYDASTNLGIVRLADPATAPGVKLFAFGPTQDPTTYTDGDSGYFELWGGAAPDFNQTVTIVPEATRTWTEHWFPVTGIGGLSYANEMAALNLGDARDATISIGVAVPGRRSGTVVVLVEGAEIYRQAMTASPDQPFSAQVVVPDGVPAIGTVTLRFLDEQDQVIAQAERWMAAR